MDRSHWGWGYAHKFGDRDTRKQVGQAAQAGLGFAPTALEDPVAIETIALPDAAVMPPKSLDALCTIEPEARIRHTYGSAYRDIVRGFRGDYDAAPDIVARPKTSDDVVRILDWATDARVAVVPYGGGTSVVGGVECRREDRAGANVMGVLSLDMTSLDAVTDIDPVSRLARIEAGALGPGLERQLSTHGLTLRHFPQSFEFSTLGGWVATRAGGHFATLYTHIDDLVASVEAIAPAGTLRTRTLPGSGAGPSPDRLLLGSEGALGVITAATVRVRPRPRFKAAATATFAQFAKAVDAARRLAQSDLHPSNCRVLDEREAALNGVDAQGRAVLLVAFESDDHPLQPWMNRAEAIIAEGGGLIEAPVRYVGPDTARADDQQGADTWRSAFIDAPYLQTTLVSLGILVDTFETACTWTGFEALHADIIKNVRGALKKAGGGAFLSCRFTHVYPDGPAPYYTFACPARPGDELAQWADIKAAASEVLLKHGATITHHHAVGRAHRPWYERQVPSPFIGALRGAKRSLDPAGIMNPGALLPL
ncbi:MAG: FAD-binding oxidoreductase [Myxococcota bacterium]